MRKYRNTSNSILWRSTRSLVVRPPFIFLSTRWMFNTAEYTRDDWLIYATLYAIGLMASICIDTILIVPFINVPIISFFFVTIGHVIVFSMSYDYIRKRYEYIITSTGVMYAFKWLWKTSRSLEFKSTSLIMLIKRPEKNIANACFYSENGDKVEFYGFSDFDNLVRTLIGIPRKDDEDPQKAYGILSSIWSNIKLSRVEYINPKGERIEAMFIINMEKFSIFLEKMKMFIKNSEVKLKCSGYEFRFQA